MANIPQIPTSQAPIVDPKTGLISREWYLFLYNLYLNSQTSSTTSSTSTTTSS